MEDKEFEKFVEEFDNSHPSGIPEEIKLQEFYKFKIEEYKRELTSTDYEAIKYSEGWFTEEEYAPIKAQREALRVQIRELEADLERLNTQLIQKEQQS